MPLKGAGIEVASKERHILYLSREDVEAVGPSDEHLLELTKSALVEHAAKRVEMPAKTAVHTRPDAFCHAMPAWVPAAQACGMKWISCYPANVGLGQPQTSGLLVLNDPATGLPLAVMDAEWITARRTPAVSALAAEAFAAPDSEVLAIIGCGVQGRTHGEILPQRLLGLREIRLFDVRAGVAEELAGYLRLRSDLRVTTGSSPEDVVRGADVVVTATAIRLQPRPIVRDDWLKPQALGLPIDLDTAWEWTSLARADKFTVDSLLEMEYFQKLGYLTNGLPPLHGETGEVVAGLKSCREPGDGLIISMNIGMGVVDVVIAREVLDLAQAGRVGRVLPV